MAEEVDYCYITINATQSKTMMEMETWFLRESFLRIVQLSFLLLLLGFL